MRGTSAAIAVAAIASALLAGCGKSRAEEGRPSSKREAEVPVEPIPVTLSNLRLQVDSMPFGDGAGKAYIKLTLDARVDAKLERRDVLAARAACTVGTQRFVDDRKLFTEGLNKLEVGDTKKVDTALFMSTPLDSAPRQCELRFALDRGRGKAVAIGTYCIVEGTITQGGCPG
jgi:hypothetical protein